jgi:hypothetical protein
MVTSPRRKLSCIAAAHGQCEHWDHSRDDAAPGRAEGSHGGASGDMSGPGRIGGEFVMASNPDTAATRLRWGRALIAAIVAEVLLICIAVPVYASMAQDEATSLLSLVVPPASFVVFAAAGYWSAKPVPGSGLLQGALAGLIAVVAYIALGFVASQFVAGTSVTDGFTPAYLAAHALKIVGGALGGWLVARKASAA